MSVFTWEKNGKIIFTTLLQGLQKFAKSNDQKAAIRQWGESGSEGDKTLDLSGEIFCSL